MAILVMFFSLLAIKKTLQKSLDFRISKFAFLVSGEINKKRRGWVLLLLRQDSGGNSRRGIQILLWQRKKASKASKKASKHIEDLIVGASCRFGLCLLQKVFGVLLLIFCGSLVLGS
jgi:hypothetical protein